MAALITARWSLAMTVQDISTRPELGAGALSYIELLPIAQRLLRHRKFSEASKILLLAADTMTGHPERDHVLGWARNAHLKAIMRTEVRDQIRLNLPPRPISQTRH